MEHQTLNSTDIDQVIADEGVFIATIMLDDPEWGKSVEAISLAAVMTIGQRAMGRPEIIALTGLPGINPPDQKVRILERSNQFGFVLHQINKNWDQIDLAVLDREYDMGNIPFSLRRPPKDIANGILKQVGAPLTNYYGTDDVDFLILFPKAVKQPSVVLH